MGRRTPGRETLRENIPFSNTFLRKNVIFGIQTAFFDGFNVLMSFLAENDTKRSRNVFKNPTLNPKHAKLNQNSYFCMQFPYSFLLVLGLMLNLYNFFLFFGLTDRF